MTNHKELADVVSDDDNETIFDVYRRVREIPANMYLRVDAWHHYACYQALGDMCRPYDAHVYAVISSFSINSDGSEKRNGHCYLPSTTIAAMIGRERRAVSESIDRLVECGLLVELKRDGVYAQKNLHADLRHPAVLYARKCQSGEIDDPQKAENAAKTAVERIIDNLQDAVDEGNEKTLEVIAAAFGDLSALSALSGELGSRMADGATFIEAAQAIAEEELNNETSDSIANENHEAADPEGWAELVGVTRNPNRINAAKEPYRALLAEGHDPDVILAAWVAAQEGIEDDDRCPQLARWLAGEERYAGYRGARACVEREEERRRRTSGCAAVDTDDVLSGFDADSYKARLESSAAKDADALDGGSVDRIIEGFKQRR